MEARARRDWASADALKAQIEAAGWRVVDHGSRTSVSPAAPGTVVVEGEPRYGSSTAVPSLLAEPDAAAWTVVVIASEGPDRVSRLLAALRRHAPPQTRVVVVANDPSDAQAAALGSEAPDLAPIAGAAPEVLRTSTRLGYATALNVGLRRAVGEFVLISDATAWPTGDAMTPLAAALHDPTVAAVGGFGLVAADRGPLRPNELRRAAPAIPDGDTTVLEGAWLAFRRSDYRDLGPLDEHFVAPGWLDVWWSLRLRAGVEPEGAAYVEPEGDLDSGDAPTVGVPTSGGPAVEVSVVETTQPEVVMPAPRRAVRLELALDREDVAWPPDRSRLNRRNMYRVLDRFGWREDLA
jgi:hypothetical protein